jgi:hypothetical protein
MSSSGTVFVFSPQSDAGQNTNNVQNVRLAKQRLSHVTTLLTFIRQRFVAYLMSLQPNKTADSDLLPVLVLYTCETDRVYVSLEGGGTLGGVLESSER